MEKNNIKKRHHRGRRTKKDRRLRAISLILLILFIASILVPSLSLIWSGIHSDEINSTDVPDEEVEVQNLIIDTDNDSKSKFKDNPEFEIKLPEGFEYTVVDITDAKPSIECQECENSLVPYVSLADDERYALATLIWLEGRGESLDCQYAIGSVILNRYTTGDYDSLFDVIYEEGQFTPAYLVEESTPTDMQIAIAEELCFHGPTIPEYITYFRSDYFHDWGNDFPVPYNNIDNTYFSYDPALVMQCMEEAGMHY